jgi:hypothetical protein
MQPHTIFRATALWSLQSNFPTNLARRQDYNQNYKTSGNVNFSPSNNGYSVQFSNAGDFVVGKGWKTGTSRYDNRTLEILDCALTP